MQTYELSDQLAASKNKAAVKEYKEYCKDIDSINELINKLIWVTTYNQETVDVTDPATLQTAIDATISLNKSLAALFEDLNSKVTTPYNEKNVEQAENDTDLEIEQMFAQMFGEE